MGGSILTKRWIGVGLLVVVTVLVVFRQRLFVWDPIARVERNGIRVRGMRVYLNSYNDILVENVRLNERYLVQARNGVPMVPGVPTHLLCLRGLACLTDQDYPRTLPLGGAGYEGEVDMTGSFVTLTDGNGAAMRVMLR